MVAARINRDRARLREYEARRIRRCGSIALSSACRGAVAELRPNSALANSDPSSESCGGVSFALEHMQGETATSESRLDFVRLRMLADNVNYSRVLAFALGSLWPAPSKVR